MFRTISPNKKPTRVSRPRTFHRKTSPIEAHYLHLVIAIPRTFWSCHVSHMVCFVVMLHNFLRQKPLESFVETWGISWDVGGWFGVGIKSEVHGFCGVVWGAIRKSYICFFLLLNKSKYYLCFLNVICGDYCMHRNEWERYSVSWQVVLQIAGSFKECCK